MTPLSRSLTADLGGLWPLVWLANQWVQAQAENTGNAVQAFFSRSSL